MKKITRFVNKPITIDGITGTVYQEENSSCEFIFRDVGAINSIPIAARKLRYNPETKQYERRDESIREKNGAEFKMCTISTLNHG